MNNKIIRPNKEILNAQRNRWENKTKQNDFLLTFIQSNVFNERDNEFQF